MSDKRKNTNQDNINQDNINQEKNSLENNSQAIDEVAEILKKYSIDSDEEIDDSGDSKDSSPKTVYRIKGKKKQSDKLPEKIKRSNQKKTKKAEKAEESVSNKVKKTKILLGIIAALLVAIIILGAIGLNRAKNGKRNNLANKNGTSTATDADAEVEYAEGAPKLKMTDKGNNRFIFSWTNSNAAQFIVYKKGYSLLDSDMQSKVGPNEWQEVTRLTCSEPKEKMSFDTGRLDPYQHLSFKIVSVYGEEQFASEVFEVDTKASTLYATIWTTKETAVFKSADKDEQLGVIPANTTLAVLDETNNRFLVSTDVGEGYIDSSYCLINLPEYLGDICRYDITDSYDSIINIQGYGIPEITGKVIPGYENVLLNDGSFVVPLLYPTAKKMAEAAELALADGYVFKIYDSFRPYISTEYVYDTYKDCVEYLVPEEQFTRITVDDYLNENYANVLSVSDLTKYEPEKASDGDASEEPSYDPNVKTYENLMLGGSYETGAFLDDSASRHNLGVAVDVMLETLQDSTELQAQTGIFDISYRSVQAYNNDNVIKMKGYMESAGFSMISSEWWHFQDNLTTTNLRPETLNEGLTIEGWKMDDVGWSYRLADGSYYVNVTQNIDGIDYMFNGDGYLVNQ